FRSMYPIWGIEAVPEGFVVVRVEYQFRRERLKEFGCETFQDLLDALPGLWAYGTRIWLRIVDDPSLHHTQQTVLPWWEMVSNGFAGAQEAEPLVRRIALDAEFRHLRDLALGALGSIVAVLLEDEEIDPECPLDRDS